jgi:site-specific DNA recombinase
MNKGDSLKPVGIWIRVSTEDQAQGESPEHHEKRGRLYAEAKNWKVTEVYDLAGVSGKSVMEHPEAKRMLADVKRGHISGLIFSKLARLARNTRELLDFSDIFREMNCDLISLQESIDTSTPSGRLFYTMVAAMAQWEREEIGERIRASVTIRAKLGKALTSVAPYGYKIQDRKPVPDEREAPIRKLAYELFAKHRRKGVVARLLNDAGYRTRIGAKWSDIAIQRTLQDPTAKGVYRINHMRKIGSWECEEKPESEWGILQVEPIVSEALWAECNRILEEQRKREKRPGKKPVHLFAGLLKCACGHPMYVRSNSPKYVCTKCYNKIPIVDMDAIFYDELKAFFASPEKIAEHLASARGQLNGKQEALLAHQQEIAAVRDEMGKTHKLYLADRITVDGFGELYRPMEERVKQLQNRLVELQAEIDLLKIDQMSADEVYEEAQSLYGNWPKLPTDDKRRLVESVVQNIVIGKEEITVNYSYLPTSKELTNSQLTAHPRSAPVHR